MPAKVNSRSGEDFGVAQSELLALRSVLTEDRYCGIDPGDLIQSLATNQTEKRHKVVESAGIIFLL